MWQALFQPTPLLKRLSDEALASLFGDSNPAFVAVHLRLGGLDGEYSSLGRYGVGCDDVATYAALACADELSASLPGVFGIHQHTRHNRRPNLRLPSRRLLQLFLTSGGADN